MEPSRSSGSSSHRHRSGRDDDADDDHHHRHRRDHRGDGRRYESSSSRHRDRSRDNDRYESNSGRSYEADREYSRRRHEDPRDHYYSSGSSSRHRRHRSRTPSSPSSRSGRRSTRDSESRSSRRRTDRDSSRGRRSNTPTIQHQPAENIRILRASRSITPTLPQSSTDALDRYAAQRHDLTSSTADRNHYFDGIKSDGLIMPTADDGDFDKEQIHKQMQERLIRHLASEGKVYPPPKPQASHPVFANDGSFLETFKRLQEQKLEPDGASGSAYRRRAANGQTAQPMFGKRRGGKILKTGIVAKPKMVEEEETTNKNDAWAMYLQEVKKYKSVSCDTDAKTRPLVK